ncbi:hypothetical protein GGH94_006299, partial [Coemansia aciculifera]
MLHIDILALVLATLAMVHFIESLYTCIKLLLSKKPLTTPLVPDTPLTPYIRKRYASFRAQELLDAKVRVAQAIRNVALSADLKQNNGNGISATHIVDIESVTLPPPTAQAGTSSTASHTADDVINLSTQATWGSLHPNNVSASSYTPRMSSSVSVGLAALQALLGVFVTQTFLIWQLSGMDSNC